MKKIIMFVLISTNVYALTYTKDIKPIFKDRCSQCHNETWPDKNWMDYETAKKHKDVIKKRMVEKTMPPSNATGLTDKERDTIIKWVDEGAKK